jgi:hypothetical protein
MLSKPGSLLRLEGAAVFLLGVYLYRWSGARWAWFFLLFLWPDLFMLGYVFSPKLGSSLYNLAHTYIFPLGLAIVSLAEHRAFLGSFTLIWLAHIGFDRALGYGLKYPTFFKDTHLQHLSLE